MTFKYLNLILKFNLNCNFFYKMAVISTEKIAIFYFFLFIYFLNYTFGNILRSWNNDCFSEFEIEEIFHIALEKKWSPHS